MFGNNDDTQNVNGNDNGAPLPPNENDNETTSTDLVSPSDNSTAIGDPTPPADTPLVNGGGVAEETDDSATEDSATGPADPMPSSDLLEIKQQALQQLSPLVNHLDQTPEEKFRTTMMMIQATDDQTMVKDAYEAAKQISDDKVRAQALLDVINEINYFTQKSES